MWRILILIIFFIIPIAHADDNIDWVMQQRLHTQLVAAKKGNEAAQLEVGTMYERGLGVEKNMQQAIKWLDKAAAQGSVTAKAELGIIYFLGRGVTPNYGKAYNLLSAAATKRIPNAQYYLGRSYELGKGTQKDLTKALYWYREAANNGYYPARAKVKALQPHLRVASTKTMASDHSSGTKSPVLDAVLAGSWMLHKHPVTYLPSSLTTCTKHGNGDTTCQSGKEVRTIGPRKITYRTHAHLYGFEPGGQFGISYTDEIIKVESGKDGGASTGDKTATTQKPRQGPKHALSCILENPKLISCIKDNLFNVRLVNTHH